MDVYISSKTVTRKTGDKIWFDDKCCRRLAKRKRRIYRKGKKISTPENKDKFLQARKVFNQAERNAKRNYSMKLKNDLADRSLSSKKWWGIVNSLSGRTGHSEIPAIEHSGTVHTRAKDKAKTSFVKPLQKNAGQKIGIINPKRLQCTLESCWRK